MYIFRKIFTLCLLATICGGLQAQDAQKTERTIALWGHVKNSITRVGIKDAFITLMREDNTLPRYLMLHLTYNWSKMPKKK